MIKLIVLLDAASPPLSIGVIAIIPMLAIAFTALIILGLILYFRKKKKT